MKEKIALLLAMVVAVSMMASLTGCKKTAEESEPTASEPATQAPTETEPSETTEPTEDYKNDISYYPFPLLNMTYEEIINKYPDAVVEGAPQGTVRLTCEQLPGVTVIFGLHKEYDKIENPVPMDLLPRCIEVTGKIYPELQVGMKYKEINFDNIPNHEMQIYMYQEITNFILREIISLEEYTLFLYIGSDLPDEKLIEPEWGAVLPWEIVEKYLGYNISQDEAWEQKLMLQTKDIANWLKNGHMDEIADFVITSIEIYRNN